MLESLLIDYADGATSQADVIEDLSLTVRLLHRMAS
jgi:hypothetical protein